MPPAGRVFPPWPLAQPFPLSCSFVSWLFPSWFLAHSACRAAAHGILGNQRAPVLSALLCPLAGAVELVFPWAWPW